MTDKTDENLERDLKFNALLMLSFFEKGLYMSPEDRKQFHSMLSFKDASTASVALLSVIMNTYALETGRTREELAAHLREILLAELG